MKVVSNMVFLTDATGSVESNPYINTNTDVGSIQVSGSFSAGTVNVQALVDVKNGEWVNIAVINTKDYTVAENIEAPGIYEFGTEGASQIRVITTSVTGTVSVFAKFTNTGV